MKILADRDIPCVAQAFADLGEVRLLGGREIGREQLRDCQCLITRTVTRVDEALLKDSPIKFVGTATIGTDHIDLDYLRKAHIGFSNAAGCNAESAAEYVISGLFALAQRKRFDPFGLRAGIVGYGNVGSRLKHILEVLGIECRVCDPPLADTGRSDQDFVDLECILRECNFISLHVPLTHSGNHPSFHLLDADHLQALCDSCVLVNAARGEVIDNKALLDMLQKRQDLCVFLDTWENEPLLSRELLHRVDLATPHIAGYSVEGRLRGTQMVLDAACTHFGVTPQWRMRQAIPPPRRLHTQSSDKLATAWQELFRQHWDINRDHVAFTGIGSHDDPSLARHFDRLRRVYANRREYRECVLEQADPLLPVKTLQALGFQLQGQT